MHAVADFSGINFLFVEGGVCVCGGGGGGGRGGGGLIDDHSHPYKQ